ncbi:MAG: metallophosphatase family protein [Proteobacteria bacterium]|nr:metallophosphatase family protein [Pseudomonadota bacterium]MBU1738050.1 metallophosphatase family protein [Pseudomonadota bacterium]
MRLAVISDIHGNFRALQAVLADIDLAGADHIVSLGDNIGYGPEPEEVVRTLVDRGIRSVMGNHELALKTDSYLQRLNPATRQSLEITRRLMGEETMEFCVSLPLNLEQHDALFVHGCPPTSCTTYLWSPSVTRLERLFSTFSARVCFYGHTHDMTCFIARENTFSAVKVKPGISEISKPCRYLINPGSVGQPRDGLSNQAKYLLWDTGLNCFENRAVPYDVQATVDLINERGFPEFNGQRLLW